MHPSLPDTDLTKPDAPGCPMNYPGFVFRTLCNDGHDAEALLAGTGLTAEDFSDPNFRSEISAVQRFILNAMDQTGDAHLGPRLAQRFDVNQIGLPAYAAMNAACLEDALMVLNRFFCLTFSSVAFHFSATERDAATGDVAIRLRPWHPLKDVEYFVCSSALIVCHNLVKALLRTEHFASRAEVTISEPDGWALVGETFARVPIRFEARENRLIFSADLLSRPLPGADPINHKRLLAVCEKFAADAGYKVSAAIEVLTFLEAQQNLGAPLSLAAEALGYSERGLRRQLDRSGTSYRDLINQVRERRARELLANSSQPIQAIAYDLGYETPSNFARSFKRWTGMTPKAFRETRAVRECSGQN